MPQIYFLVGASVLALVVLFLVLGRVEGDEDVAGIRVGQPPEATDGPTDATAAAMGRNTNAPAGSRGGE